MTVAKSHLVLHQHLKFMSNYQVHHLSQNPASPQKITSPFSQNPKTSVFLVPATNYCFYQNAEYSTLNCLPIQYSFLQHWLVDILEPFIISFLKTFYGILQLVLLFFTHLSLQPILYLLPKVFYQGWKFTPTAAMFETFLWISIAYKPEQMHWVSGKSLSLMLICFWVASLICVTNIRCLVAWWQTVLLSGKIIFVWVTESFTHAFIYSAAMTTL